MSNATSKSSRRAASPAPAAAVPDGPDPAVVDDADPGATVDAVVADAVPGVEAAPVDGAGVAPELRYFVLDGRPKKTADPDEAAHTLAAGWTEIDVLTYQTIVNEIEMARLAEAERKREEARREAAQAAQDAAAQMPPEGNAADDIAGMKAKTLEERVTRIEAILATMGWPV